MCKCTDLLLKQKDAQVSSNVINVLLFRIMALPTGATADSSKQVWLNEKKIHTYYTLLKNLIFQFNGLLLTCVPTSSPPLNSHNTKNLYLKIKRRAFIRKEDRYIVSGC